MGISASFYSPPTSFFSGGSISLDVPFPYDVSIDGHNYFVDWGQYDRSTLETLRQALDQTGEPGDQSLSIEGLWKRTQTDWSLGAGQDFFDDQNSTGRRFSTSKGVDIWTDRELCLLPDTERKRSSANTNLQMLVVGSYLYIIDGSQAYYCSDPTPTSPTFTSVTLPNAPTSMTTTGDTMYFATSAGVVSTPLGSTTQTAFSAYVADKLFVVNNHLIATTTGNTLVELDSLGAVTTLLAHNNASFVWQTVVGTPSGIFAGGNNGDSAEFYFIAYNAATGDLTTPVPAGDLPTGEKIYAMAFYGGVVLLGTSLGFRIALIVNDRGLSPAPVIETTSPVKALATRSDFCWFAGTNFDGSSTGLYRARLSRFTDVDVPAYASDLMATAQGEIQGVVSYGNKRYFAVSASGIWGEVHSANYVATGTLDVGWITLTSPERKVAASIDLRHEPLDGTIFADLENEAGDTVTVGTSSVADSLSPSSTWSGQNLNGERFKIIWSLTRGSTPTTTPCLIRWSFRGLIAPLQVDAIICPIILYQEVDDSIVDGSGYGFDVDAEWTFLKALEASRQVVNYQEGTVTQQVTLRSVSRPKGSVRGFNTDRTGLNSTVFVRMTTIDTGS